ncbi:MAG: helix-turn-helix domain-containing protein [Candidatus Omnitrophica bacterium]|nr:helix-turn-helix domain-containing protein [Candidatus Omnitrophota bacterium]
MKKIIVLICSVILFSLVIRNVTYAQQQDNEVLTLNEAAFLLRISADDLDGIARRNLIPGRFIGQEWRFSKAALLRWLGGEEKVSEAPLSKSNLSQIVGRGEDSSDTQNATPIPDNKTETIGNKPDLGTAEDIFLRNERILLKAKELSIEFGLLYSYSDQQDITSTSFERETYTSTVGLRYGLADNLQLFTSTPYMFQTDTITSPDEREREKRSDWGDVSLGLRSSVLREGLNIPEIILSIEGQIPTGQSSYALGAGASLVKSLDPAVLFANFNYNYTFSKDYDDITLLAPKNTFSVSLGYAYALNDTVTLSALTSGVFTGRTNFDNDVVLQSRKQFSLQFGITSLIWKTLYIEPTVSFGLNRAASDVTFGVDMVYTFGSEYD